VFDSGVGGLTVLHELLVALPREDFLYLGDTARFPYGERSAGELAGFCAEIADELLRRRVKLLVVACNSATAAALPALQRRMMETTIGVDVLGVVRPEALRAVAATRTGRIGLLATPTTVASGAYEQAVHAIDPHVTLHAVPCPTLAPLIQAGQQFDERAVRIVRQACAPLRAAGVDTVILGCTHYPLISPMLQRMLGPSVTLVSSGAALARQVEHVLSTRGLAVERRRGRVGERLGDGLVGDGPGGDVEGGGADAVGFAMGVEGGEADAPGGFAMGVEGGEADTKNWEPYARANGDVEDAHPHRAATGDESGSAAGYASGSVTGHESGSAVGHESGSDPAWEEGDYRFLCTGDVAAFRELGTRFLQMPLGEVEHIRLAPAEALA
jgi:glutamate racemase